MAQPQEEINHGEYFDQNIDNEEPVYTKIDGGFLRVPYYIKVSCYISKTAKDVYEILLHYFQKNNQCFPGQERVALDLGLSARQVMRGLNELRECELISWEKRGYGQTNLYKLLAIEPFIKKSREEYIERVAKWKKAHPNSSSSIVTSVSGLDTTSTSQLDTTPMSYKIEEDINRKSISTQAEGLDKGEGNSPSSFKEFLAVFNRTTGRKFTGGGDIKNHLHARTEEGWTLQMIEEAVKNANEDDFLVGNNPRRRNYLTPEYILRPANLDKWYNASPIKQASNAQKTTPEEEEKIMRGLYPSLFNLA